MTGPGPEYIEAFLPGRGREWVKKASWASYKARGWKAVRPEEEPKVPERQPGNVPAPTETRTGWSNIKRAETPEE